MCARSAGSPPAAHWPSSPPSAPGPPRPQRSAMRPVPGMRCGLGPPPGSSDFAAALAGREADMRTRGYQLVCDADLARYDIPWKLRPLADARPEFEPVALAHTPFRGLQRCRQPGRDDRRQARAPVPAIPHAGRPSGRPVRARHVRRPQPRMACPAGRAGADRDDAGAPDRPCRRRPGARCRRCPGSKADARTSSGSMPTSGARARCATVCLRWPPRCRRRRQPARTRRPTRCRASARAASRSTIGPRRRPARLPPRLPARHPKR